MLLELPLKWRRETPSLSSDGGGLAILDETVGPIDVMTVIGSYIAGNCSCMRQRLSIGTGSPPSWGGFGHRWKSQIVTPTTSSS